MAQAAGASTSELERLSDRLAASRPPYRRRRGWLAVIFAIAAAMALLSALFQQASDFTLVFKSSSEAKLPPVLEKIRLHHISALQKGRPPFDPEIKTTQSEQLLEEARELFFSHPQDPAFYQAYVTRFFKQNGSLPLDYEETWRRIDPFNGFWPAMVPAMSMPSGLYESVDSLIVSNTLTPEKEQDLFQEASRKLKWVDYRRELARRERDSFRSAANLMEDGFLQSAVRRAESQATPVIGAALPSLSRGYIQGEEESAASILAWLRLDNLRRMQPGNVLPVPPETTDLPLVFGLFGSKGSSEPPEPMAAIARHQEEVASVLKTEPMSVTQEAMLPTLRDSRMFMMGSFEGNPFVARRQAEFCMFARLAILPLSLLAVALFIAAGAEILRRPNGLRFAACGLQPLLPFSLQGKLLLWSVALPGLVVSAALASPLGGWDLDWHSSTMEMSVKPLFTIPLVAGTLLSLSTLLHLVDREISIQLKGLAAERFSPWPSRLSIAISLIATFAAGLIGRWLPKGLHDQAYSALFALLAIPLLLILWKGGAALFRPREAVLTNVVKARLLLPGLAALTSVLLGAIFLSRVAEARALTQDPFAAIGPDTTRYENARSSRLTAEFRQILTAP